MTGRVECRADGALATRAPAKVNLTLHVLGRRSDGYHELDSLVAFAGAADGLSLEPGKGLTLSVEGPRAGAAGPLHDNLVLRAARALLARRPTLRAGRLVLTKRLPAAAGIGGGSSDAAAVLRLLATLNDIAIDDPDVVAAARETGADIPVCLAPTARTMRGAGEHVGPALGLTPLHAVLVNPAVAVPTAGVFRALALEPGDRFQALSSPLPERGAGRDEVIASIASGRNDLEPPALGLAPEIGEALSALRATPGCRLARMSGSGATVFGLYGDCHEAARAARQVRSRQPGWWVVPTLLR